jgi:hypothetical protein
MNILRTMTSNEVRLRSDALEWREVEGEIVALDLQGSSYFAVNRAGAALWEALAGGTTREDLVSKLVTEFGIDRDGAARDVDAFLAALAERELLEA